MIGPVAIFQLLWKFELQKYFVGLVRWLELITNLFYLNKSAFNFTWLILYPDSLVLLFTKFIYIYIYICIHILNSFETRNQIEFKFESFLGTWMPICYESDIRNDRVLCTSRVNSWLDKRVVKVLDHRLCEYEPTCLPIFLKGIF